ncbi:MAG: hypothetical protein ABI433_00985 [Burkholderiaceae bacterium]
MSAPDESVPIPFDHGQEEPLEGDPTTIAAINARFARGSARMARLEAELRANTLATKQNGEQLVVNTTMTREMYEILTMAKTGIAAIGKLGRGLATVGRWVVKAVKWLTPLAVGAVAIYHAVEALLHGGSPK